MKTNLNRRNDLTSAHDRPLTNMDDESRALLRARALSQRASHAESARSACLISVIIPAHNAEETLRRAAESTLGVLEAVGQNATLFAGGDRAAGEVLIIENTSEDGTWQLALDLQAEHPGVVHAFQCEAGVSNGRNRGLDEASGEWILFLDADDYFLEGAGEILRDAVHFTGTDLVVFSYEAGKKTVHVCPAAGERFSGDDAIEKVSARMIEDPTRYTAVWSKLFRRERIEYGKLRFDPSLRLSEDSHFFIRYLSHCRRIRLVDQPVYHYSTDTASVVRTWDGSKEEGYRRSLSAVRAFLETQPEPVREAFAGYGMMQFNLLMVREVFARGAHAVPAGRETGADPDPEGRVQGVDSDPGAGPADERTGGRAAADPSEQASGRRPFSIKDRIRRMKEISEKEPFASAIRAYDPARHKGARYLPIRLLRSHLPAGAAAVYEARVLQNARKEKRR